tara:strand:+ start:609 stop:2720 length:2112 start_codon:yes stop_codon:yes gene_type:complete
MKQIIQDLKSGETLLQDVPSPCVSEGNVLIKTHKSLVSLGTEKMLVDFGKANYLQKIRQQPEKVKQVLQKIKTDGLRPTIDAVFRKLEEPMPLGYSNAGEVIAIGKGVSKFRVGDRVISNGHHAEVVNIPQNLVAKIPENVSYEEASFTVIGSIGLQGIRLINPTLGETIVVIGLGLIGLITAQLLKVNGCNVIGFDFDENKIKLAKSWGIKSFNSNTVVPEKIVKNLTDGYGADGVLICASTKSDNVVSQAANISRLRGRIVLVGVVGLNINRSDFYEKELSFQVSCSYGPGRYDNFYENEGMDYPIGFVRWTEQRNFVAVLDALSKKNIDVNSLITERVDLDDYVKIYGDMSKKDSIASIISYSSNYELKRNVKLYDKKFEKSEGVVGIIGAGNFTSSTILPNLHKLKSNVKYIASLKGLSGTLLAKKFRIPNSTTDLNSIFSDHEVSGVIITTRHNLHASQVIKALESGKHVFVEKPLALTLEELNIIENLYRKSNNSITVGFNRRFSPFIQEVKKTIGNSKFPLNVIATMNSGYIPENHWVHDLEIGGGRIIGEACHYIDLISFLAESEVESVVMNAQGKNPKSNTDNGSILLKYKNGSQGIINYFSNGYKGYSKEHISIYSQNKNIIIDNFRKIYYYGYNKKNKTITQDKGHFEQFKRWNQMLVKGGDSIIPFDSILNTSKAAIACIESLKNKSWIDV